MGFHAVRLFGSTRGSTHHAAELVEPKAAQPATGPPREPLEDLRAGQLRRGVGPGGVRKVLIVEGLDVYRDVVREGVEEPQVRDAHLEANTERSRKGENRRTRANYHQESSNKYQKSRKFHGKSMKILAESCLPIGPEHIRGHLR